ncbi:MAG: NUDIX hydrolase [Desertimonas sp.]
MNARRRPVPTAGTAVATVIAELRARRPIDERERSSIERTLTELDRLTAPFDIAADPVHVTGSALIVGRRGIVLLKHRRLGIWVQPGGHVDPGETPWDAAAREAVEETGLSVVAAGPRPERLAHVDVHDGGRGHTHLDLRFLFFGGDADPAPPPEESQDVHWFGWAAAIERAEPAMTALLRHLATSQPES